MRMPGSKKKNAGQDSSAQNRGTSMRLVKVKALTEAGWITGNVHVPGQVRFFDFITRAPDFLSLTGVTMEAHTREIPFLAVQKHAIVFMSVESPEDPMSAESTGAIMDEHQVSCLLSLGRLEGTIRTRPGRRLSDSLTKSKSLMAVTGCKYQIILPRSQNITQESRDFVLLNAEKIIGLAERDSPAQQMAQAQQAT